MIAAARRTLRKWIEFRRYAAAAATNIDVKAAVDGGYVDRILIHADGIVAAEGWGEDLDALSQALALEIGARRLAPTHAYRVRRPDVASVMHRPHPFVGAVVEWVLDSSAAASKVTLLGGTAAVAQFELPAFRDANYAHLQTATRVLGRDDIYGHGPPVKEVSSEIVDLARTLPPPILDFGCGAGALLRALRREGLEVYGLELETEEIRAHLLDEAKPFITLYDGQLPSPFRDGEFASVTCSEVLEHIPNPSASFREVARLARSTVMITVPDMSAIPRGFHHAVVPWHLLEATHVNFFTQHSLQQMLAPYATHIEVARIGMVQCDRLKYYTSLAAIARLT